MNIQIVEEHKRAIKLKWMERFKRSYPHTTSRFSEQQIGPLTRFLIAKNGKTDLGFTRITNKSSFFDGLGEIWCVSDVYVKPAYRHQGIARDLITHAIDNCSARIIVLDPDVFKANRCYYRALNFNRYFVGQPSEMCWLLHKDISPLILYSAPI